MPRPTHFELPADNPARAIAFYEQLFGWEFRKWDGPVPYWLVLTGQGAGIDGGLASRQHPGQGPVNVVDVPDCRAYFERATAAGAQVVMEPTPLPGVGLLAYCTDPEGNTFGMLEGEADAG